MQHEAMLQILYKLTRLHEMGPVWIDLLEFIYWHKHL